MRKLFFVIFTMVSVFIQAQELTLDSCYLLARENHPQLKKVGVIDQLYSLTRRSINASNLPQINLSGRATYQSDVVEINLPIPGFSNAEFSKDQYKVYLDVKQKLFDFGLSRNKKNVAAVDYRIDQQKNEVDLYKIKETVNTLFFNALALQQNNDVLMLKRLSLQERIKVVQSAVKNGVMLRNELDNLKAESLLTDQQQMELLMNKQTTLDLLGILIGRELFEETFLQQPHPKGVKPTIIVERPEIQLFELQKSKLSYSEKLLASARLPYLYAFGQAGYGRPGLNMLSNDFDDWYIGGVGFAWNLWDGNKVKNDKAALRLQKKYVDVAKENFERAVRMSLTKELNNIKKIENMLIIDNELVKLKETIVKRSASALDNGVITSADYIRDLNASLQAKAMKQLHQLQLIQSRVNYHTINGDK